MKILSFGASSSSDSINRKFAKYSASQITDAVVSDLDLRKFDLPIYSVDLEEKDKIPSQVSDFLDSIRSHDAIVLSLAEHNGSYTAFFKNLLDWTSRLEQKLWCEKPMFLLSTSPGGRGGASVMQSALSTFPHLGADIKASFSLPSFYDNFSEENGITDPELKKDFQESIQKFIS